MRFDLLFKDCRKILGLTQAEMGKKIGINQAHVCKIENRSLTPGAEIFVRLYSIDILWQDGRPEVAERFSKFFKEKK